MLSEKMRKEYSILNDVYGNYISVQEVSTQIILKNKKAGESFNILEIGSGTGYTTELILKLKDVNVVSIDIDPDMTLICQNKFPNNKRLELINIDALSFLIETKSESFDAVISAFTIHNFDKIYREEIHRNIYRVLKNKGVFLNIDKFTSDDESTALEALKFRISKYIDTLGKAKKYTLLTEWINHYLIDFLPENRMSFDKTELELQNIGFNNVFYNLKSEIQMIGRLIAEKK